jgi:thiol:disulfide interchange protein
MSRKRILAAVVLAAFVVTAAFAAAKTIKWQTDFDKAAESAKKSHKPMMVDFYTDWCGWCKKLDREVYTDKRIVELSAKFVNVKVDGDKQPKLIDKYNVEGYPTIVFYNSKGKEVSRIVGYRNPDDFLAAMKDALKKAK